MEVALEYLKQGIFGASDYGWHAGLKDWTPLRELLAPATPQTLQSGTFASPAITRRIDDNARPGNRSRQIGQAGSRPEGSGWMILLNLFLTLVVVALGCLRFGLGGETARRWVASIGLLLKTQSHQEQQAQPAPAPAASPALAAKQLPDTPQGAPAKAFDPAELAGNRAAWPRTVILKEDTVFPALYNSQVVGSVTVPRGTPVRLVGIVGTELNLEFQGGTTKVPWNLTDLEARATHTPGFEFPR
jgi:hypothetical protein